MFQALSAIKSDESLAAASADVSGRQLFSSEFLRDIYGSKILQQLERADGEEYCFSKYYIIFTEYK